MYENFVPCSFTFGNVIATIDSPDGVSANDIVTVSGNDTFGIYAEDVLSDLHSCVYLLSTLLFFGVFVWVASKIGAAVRDLTRDKRGD